MLRKRCAIISCRRFASDRLYMVLRIDTSATTCSAAFTTRNLKKEPPENYFNIVKS